ncbi:MAG: hypothetical protein A4E49_02327 [Methanosaeta sp. PtaU1.Bin112]|jgi:hypothetical protein|nr:MAG: hypothetical protein A4E49_02327 [Methanosaeta sp. PtaU1.Bin112]
MNDHQVLHAWNDNNTLILKLYFHKIIQTDVGLSTAAISSIIRTNRCYKVVTYLCQKIIENHMANIGVRKGKKIKLSISIMETNATWIEDQIVAERYRSISDAIDSLIREKKLSETV